MGDPRLVIRLILRNLLLGLLPRLTVQAISRLWVALRAVLGEKILTSFILRSAAHRFRWLIAKANGRSTLLV